MLSGEGGLAISAEAETVKFTEIPKMIAAGSVVLKDAKCAAVSRKLAAANCVRWRGRGELLHLPWDPPSLGPFLLIDLWSGFAGAAMALLSLGVSVYCLAAETDPFVRAVAAENLDVIVHVNSVEEVSVDMVRDFLQRRKVKGIILGGGSPCQGNSFLNKGRRGTGDERTWQTLQLVRIRDELTSAFPSLSFLENVALMPEDVRSMYCKLLVVEPIECCAGMFGWVRRSRLNWRTASGGFPASQRGLELPLGVQISRVGSRCVIQWHGKPIPGWMRAVDGFQLIARKPQEVVNGNGGRALFPFTREFQHPDEKTQATADARADGSKIAEDSHSSTSSKNS